MGSQAFVAAAYLVEAALKRGDIKRPLDPSGERQVVRRVAGLNLIQVPEALLGERWRE
jgi:hypothetical protein